MKLSKVLIQISHLAFIVTSGCVAFFALLLLFAQTANSVQAAPELRPVAEIITGAISVTHTATTTHQMSVFADGRISNQFLTDNGRNQIDQDNTFSTTIAVMFNQHVSPTVDAGLQGDFVPTVPTAPITLNTTSTMPGYSEDSYAVYASQVLSYQITQRTLATATSNCVVMELFIRNTGTTTLTEGKLLYMVNVDVANSSIGDTGHVNLDKKMVYLTDRPPATGNETAYAMGVSLLEGDLGGYGIVEPDRPQFPDLFNDLSLRNEMITPTNNIIPAGETNLVVWLVANIPDLALAQEEKLVYGICANSADDTEEAIENILLDNFEKLVNLSVLKSAVPSPGSSVVVNRDYITYSITISNTGNYYVNNIVVTDTIPATTNLITYSVSQGSIIANSSVITADIGRLYPTGKAVTVTLVVEPNNLSLDGSVITNQAFINSEPLVTVTNIVTHQIIHHPALTLTKQTIGAEVVGTPLTYMLSISNIGGSVATNVVVTDTVPAGAYYLSGGTYISGRNAVSWTIPTINIGSQQTVTFVVTTCQLSLANNAYRVVTSTRGISSSLGAELVSILTPPALNANFTYAPTVIVMGETYEFFDTGTTTGGPITEYNWNFGDGSVATGITSSHTYPNAGAYTVTLSITDTCGYTDLTTRTVLVHGPVLTVTKYVDPVSIIVGQRLTYTIVISNGGQGLATQVAISDTLPLNTQFVTGSVIIAPALAGGTQGLPPVIANGITVAVNSLVTVTYMVTANTNLASDTIFTNTAAVTSYQTSVPVRGTVTNTVDVQFDLELDKTVSPVPALPGQAVTYTIMYTNHGPGMATGVIITDEIPVTLTRVVLSSSGAQVVPTGSISYVWQVANLAPGAGGIIFVTGIISPNLNADTTFTNTAVISAGQINDETGALANTDSAANTITIPRISFIRNLYTAGEADNQAVITVTLTAAPYTTVTVNYATGSGSATAGQDYTALSDQLTFPPGTSTLTFTVPITDDSLDENDETVALTLSNAENAILTAPTSATLTLVDNDAPPDVSFANPPYTADEGDGTAVVTVTLSSQSGLPITVTYRITNGTATSGDYISHEDNLYFAPGTVVQTFTVTITDDHIVEPNETVSLQLLNNAVNAGGVPASTILTIIDDDVVLLSIEKRSTFNAAVTPGENITYTIVVSNSGNATATGAIISDILSEYTQFVEGSASIVPSGAGTLSTPPELVSNLTIPAGEQIAATFAVEVFRPLTNSLVITNTATVTSEQTSGAESSTVTNTVVSIPSVSINANAPPTAFVGDDLVFTFAVTNTGDSLLQLLTVVDSIAGTASFVSGDTNGNGWLELTETWLYTTPCLIRADDVDPLTHTVTVTAADALNTIVTANDSVSTDIVFRPVLTITKNGPSAATVGQAVVFTFEVSHTPQSDGSVVSNVVVSDDYAGIATLSTNGDGDNLLEMGETWVYTANYIISPTTPNPFTNTGTVWATNRDNNMVTAKATHRTTLSGFSPSLFVDKDGPLLAEVGENVEFMFTVINVNELAVRLYKLRSFELGIAETGDGSPIDLAVVTDTVAGTAVYVSGDWNRNHLLDGAEAWVFTASHTVTNSDPDPLVNTVFVQGWDPEGDEVTATDTHNTDIAYSPQLQIASFGPPTAIVGQSVNLTVTVGHYSTGDTSPVSSLTVSNNLNGQVTQLGGDTNGNRLLEAGELWTFVISYTIQFISPGDLVNTITVEGVDADGEVVTAVDSYTISVSQSPDTRFLYLPVVFKNK